MAERKARALWIEAAGRAVLREEPLPSPGPEQVEVQATFSGISRGTESLVFQGHVPPAERERMAAPFQAGAFTAPVK